MFLLGVPSISNLQPLVCKLSVSFGLLFESSLKFILYSAFFCCLVLGSFDLLLVQILPFPRLFLSLCTSTFNPILLGVLLDISLVEIPGCAPCSFLCISFHFMNEKFCFALKKTKFVVSCSFLTPPTLRKLENLEDRE